MRQSRDLGVTPLKASSLCLSKPCQNGATCRDGPTDFLCRCPSIGPAFANSHCSSSNALCHVPVCHDNATCQLTNAYSQELACHCTLDESGHICQSQVQLCAKRHCGEEVWCKPLLEPSEPGYVCVCRPGYKGALCEEEVDHCTPNPCQNGALCRSQDDGPTCFCVPGFQGARCDIEVDECISRPCQNGATCVNKIGHYSCLCSPGYTGASCETEIDECQSQPCLHGGSCRDNVNGFSCTCAAGFQGDRCGINIDECWSQPCQNGATCIDGINSYACNCAETGFIGVHCEEPIPPCYFQPCLNSAICQDKDGNYTCKCWPGFAGSHCEVDVDECASSPCLRGGTCMELSQPGLYGIEPLFPPHYDPSHVAGFICKCQPGHTGVLCEEDVIECEKGPCQNGGVCEDTQRGYICHCPPQSQNGVLYGGRNCTERLLGCEGHECQNEATCVPFLSEGLHGYSCSCRPGFAGSRCQMSTTFSFESPGSYLQLRTPLLDVEASSNITLSFRTVLPSAMLFQRGSDGGALLSLELLDGRLHLSLSIEDSTTSDRHSWAVDLPHNVTDGEWHAVEAVLDDGVLALRLLRPCEGEWCQSLTEVESSSTGMEPTLQSTFIGGLAEGDGPSKFGSTFIGCLRDLFVDSQLMVPEDWLSSSAVNVTRGCNHWDRCLENPCENRGHCINLWQGYQCKCQRPYVGQNCSDEYVTARFGNGDSQSYAVFTVSGETEQDMRLSMFVRTRRQTGLLLVLANATSQYLRMWLDQGRVVVQVNNFEAIRGESSIDDGDIHFVSVTVEQNQMTLSESDRRAGPVDVRSVHVQDGDAVYVGGLVEPKAAAAFGGYFKGCIQDLRLNDRNLEFFPLGVSGSTHPPQRMANVTRGCTGDNSCMKNPCENGGMCYAVWDDFTCVCPPNTAGRRCEEVKWCELMPCPPEATCHTIDHGYECISNATFLDEEMVSYRGNGYISRNLSKISFTIRTRRPNAAVLHAEKGLDFVTVSVQEGLLHLEMQSGTASAPLKLHSQRFIADGEWHSVELFMSKAWASTSTWTMSLDGMEPVISEEDSGNLDFLREGADIFLGGLGPEAGWNLIGCLGTVEIGGIALPYYSNSEVKLPRTQVEQFLRMSPGLVQSGCRGADVCRPDPCLNLGECYDLFNAFNCTCPSGLAGPRCELTSDTCASNPCIHGNCTSVTLAYECVCEVGYTGTNCEVEVDTCHNHKCVNGGTCLRGINQYSCLCAENFTGPYCNNEIEEIPWYITVKDVVPKLPVSVCGDEHHSYTCFNGGNCTETDLTCNCMPGFTGHRCEQDVDECKSNPCLNGGYCRNMVNKFHCVCDMSYAGETCQIDLNAESVASDLLLSVSLVSVVLLLVLFASATALVMALNRRATHGTYSPSRQEKEGSRVEMWNIVQPPPMERLI
ncbi:protein crumbs homolog 1 [Chanos chanos]|uniref:Protein crumbs homolog 1 n=1 Tax=Chanos chanos TaxID=29144 RepID=A0A6J2W7L6_CHACN|nr:protein crumbs homolog 1 [Chanos chanos]